MGIKGLNTPLPPWFSWDQVVLFFKLIRDPEVPWWLKTIPALSVLYLLSPFDLIPDFLFPGIGEIDDIIVLAAAITLFNRLAPKARVNAHLSEMGKRGRNR